MRRLFVPSVVLLVLSVVMMVWSWCGLHIVAPRGRASVTLGFGELSLFWITESRLGQTGVWSWGFGGINLPTTPVYTAHHRAIESASLPAAANWVGGPRVQIPTWYFLVMTGLLTALLWRPWSRHRRRYGNNCCAHCGYDLSGVHSLCPECGKPINTQRATP